MPETVVEKIKEKEIVEDISYKIREIVLNKDWEKEYGKDYDEYRKKWKDASENFTVFPFPLFLEVESIYACNYRCPFCPTTILGQSTNCSKLSEPLFTKLFAEAQKLRLYSVNFSHGGEPTMRRDLPQLIARAREAGIIDRMIHTNGSLLTPDFSRQIIEAGLTKINFSLDSVTKDTYETKVRIGGNYAKVIRNITDFLRVREELGKSQPRVRVSFVITKDNMHEVDDFISFWEGKADVIAIQECIDFTGNLTKEVPQGIDYKNMKWKCSQLFQLLTIRATGDITPCENIYELDHSYVLGNLATHTIQECWLGDKMTRLRKAHLTGCWDDVPKCKQCIWNMLRENEDSCEPIGE